jgi:hypothetical protein
MSRFDSTDGWLVAIETDHLRRFDILVMARRRGDDLDVITGLGHPGDGSPEITTVSAMMASTNEQRWVFPRGVLQAIAEHLKPGPGSDEVKRLEEALAVERARVDRCLNAATIGLTENR